MKLVIQIPCYNEEKAIPLFYEEILKTAKEMPYVQMELLFVDDGSKHGTLQVLRNLRKDNHAALE